MSMTRGEFERHYAGQIGRTVSELRAQGYHSARCKDEESGWLAVALPPGNDAEAEIMILKVESRGVSRLDLHPFGTRLIGDGTT